MSEAENYKVQVSVKHGSNGSVLTNVRAKTWDEFAEDIEKLTALVPVINVAVEELQGLDAVQQTFQGTTTVQPQAQATQGADWPLQKCMHNQLRKLITGNSKRDGSPYKMQVCVIENDPAMPKCPVLWPPKG